MIASLHGKVTKHEVPWVTVDVHGVGYEVQCTLGLWERLVDGSEAFICTYTFVREDRLELFGFGSVSERMLFVRFLGIPGVGPKTALALSSVPAGTLLRAVDAKDTRILSGIKGIGKKMAEKLLLELQTLAEKGILVASSALEDAGPYVEIDEDAADALTNLGYDRRSILRKLREMPTGLTTTEERVKHVLQVL